MAQMDLLFFKNKKVGERGIYFYQVKVKTIVLLVLEKKKNICFSSVELKTMVLLYAEKKKDIYFNKSG